jgi:hypothetical protein
MGDSPIFSNALGVTWPMVKLASHDAEVVIPTAFARMLVCMISTGLYGQIVSDKSQKSLTRPMREDQYRRRRSSCIDRS